MSYQEYSRVAEQIAHALNNKQAFSMPVLQMKDFKRVLRVLANMEDAK